MLSIIIIKKVNINTILAFNFSYYNDNIKIIKNFVVERRYIGKLDRNKSIYPSWNNLDNKYLTNIGFFSKFFHLQDVSEGYITTRPFNKLKLVIVRGFTKNMQFDGFNKPNIFVNNKPSYLNVKHFGILKCISVFKIRKCTLNSNDIIESINNSLEIQDNFNSDLEEKIDLILQNGKIRSILTSQENFYIDQHFESCLNIVDKKCSQCILIEEKYGILKVTSELIKLNLGY